CARSLEDGRLLWEQPLRGPASEGREPPVTWHVRRLRDGLVAYPTQARAVQLEFRWLFGSVQWKMGDPGGAGEGRDLSVVCCRPGTGQAVQRLNFRAEVPRVRTQFRPGLGSTVLPQGWAWRGLAPDPRPGVQILERGGGSSWTVVRGGKVWA